MSDELAVRQLEHHLELLAGPAIRPVRVPHVEAVRLYILELHERIRAFGRAEQLWAAQLEEVRRDRDRLTAALDAVHAAELERERVRHLAANRSSGECPDPVPRTRPYLDRRAAELPR